MRQVCLKATSAELIKSTLYLPQYGINGVEDAKAICAEKASIPTRPLRGDAADLLRERQVGYVVGAAIAIKKGCKNAADAAEAIGEGLQAFCIPGSVADDRKVGIGHGSLAARLLREEMVLRLPGRPRIVRRSRGRHQDRRNGSKVRKNPLRVISTAWAGRRTDHFAHQRLHRADQVRLLHGRVAIVKETPYSTGLRGKVRCYGADDVREGVAVMWKEDVDVSITGNSTNPTASSTVAGTYKKERVLAGKKYFSVASRRRHGRTLHPTTWPQAPLLRYDRHDGPYALGRPVRRFVVGSPHVEMMGFLGMGNNPMVGATVASRWLSSRR